MTASTFEFGLDSFGEVATDSGRALDDAETVRLLLEEAELAEASGWTSSVSESTTDRDTSTAPLPYCSPLSPPSRNGSASVPR
ncbi:hypothetical protein GCM10017744_006030 [Streptomyces antimycoticus]